MNSSTAQVLDVAEDLDGGPNIVPALDLGRDDDIHHLKAGKHEGEEHQVEDVQQDDVKGPAHHIVMRVEDVKHDHAHCHHKVHCEADEIANCVSATHVSVDFFEGLIHLFGFNSCHHLPKLQWHPED
jgi:hypothetical protein